MQDDSIFIRGFGIANYRSFGQDLQLVGPLSKVNIFVGRNNVGKSNVLAYVCNILPRLNDRNGKWVPKELDKHLGETDNVMRAAVCWKPDPEALIKRLNVTDDRYRNQINGQWANIQMLLDLPTVRQKGQFPWFMHQLVKGEFKVDDGWVKQVVLESENELKAKRNYHNFRHFWEGIAHALRIQFPRNNFVLLPPAILQTLSPPLTNKTPIEMIPAFRQVKWETGMK